MRPELPRSSFEHRVLPRPTSHVELDALGVGGFLVPRYSFKAPLVLQINPPPIAIPNDAKREQRWLENLLPWSQVSRPRRLSDLLEDESRVRGSSEEGEERAHRNDRCADARTMRIRARAVTIAVLAMIARPALAQRPDTKPQCGVLPLYGLHVGAPQKVALAAGFALPHVCTADEYTGPEFFAEAGLGGAKAGTGLVNFGAAGAAAQTRVAVLRTWRHPWRVAAAQTFVGPEVRVTYLLLTFGAGFYWRTAGHAPGDVRFPAFSGGIGF